MPPAPPRNDRQRRRRGAPSGTAGGWRALRAALAAVALAGCVNSTGSTEPSLLDDALSFATRPPPVEENRIVIADKLLASGDVGGALRFYREAATAPGADADAMVRYGQVLFRTGSFDYAAGAFSDALTRDDRLVEARRGLGAALMAQGRIEEARPHVEQAVRDAADARAIRNLAVLRTLEGQPEEARIVYAKASARWPSDLDLRTNHALFEAIADDCTAADGIGHAVMTSPYVRSRHLAGYALVMALCGREDEARQTAGRVMSGPGVAALLRQATAARGADTAAARAIIIGAVPTGAAWPGDAEVRTAGRP